MRAASSISAPMTAERSGGSCRARGSRSGVGTAARIASASGPTASAPSAGTSARPASPPRTTASEARALAATSTVTNGTRAAANTSRVAASDRLRVRGARDDDGEVDEARARPAAGLGGVRRRAATDGGRSRARSAGRPPLPRRRGVRRRAPGTGVPPRAARPRGPSPSGGPRRPAASSHLSPVALRPARPASPPARAPPRATRRRGRRRPRSSGPAPSVASAAERLDVVHRERQRTLGRRLDLHAHAGARRGRAHPEHARGRAGRIDRQAARGRDARIGVDEPEPRARRARRSPCRRPAGPCRARRTRGPSRSPPLNQAGAGRRRELAALQLAVLRPLQEPADVVEREDRVRPPLARGVAQQQRVRLVLVPVQRARTSRCSAATGSSTRRVPTGPTRTPCSARARRPPSPG